MEASTDSATPDLPAVPGHLAYFAENEDGDVVLFLLNPANGESDTRGGATLMIDAERRTRLYHRSGASLAVTEPEYDFLDRLAAKDRIPVVEEVFDPASGVETALYWCRVRRVSALPG